MLSVEKRREAFNAIWAAQPHWTPKQVRACIQMIPTSTTYAAQTTSERDRMHAEHQARLQVWLQRYLYTPNATPPAQGERLMPDPEPAPAPAPAKGTKAAPTVATGGGLLKPGSKKQRVLVMLKQPGGVTVDVICKELGVTEPAAKALIGDVKRAGVTITRTGDTYTCA